MWCRVGSIPMMVVVAGLFSALGGCQPKPAAEEGTPPGEEVGVEQAKAEIAARLAAYLDAYKRKDVEAAADFWTEDGRLLAPGVDRGRAEVLETLRSTFASGTQINVLDRHTVELFVHGNAAYEIGQAVEVIAPPGQVPDTLRNNLMTRWEKGPDGKWRIDRAVRGTVSSRQTALAAAGAR